jgi:hypothetical protein
MEEIQLKMVPETILTNVSGDTQVLQPAHSFLVHDQDDGQSRESMAHAQAVRFADRYSHVPHLCLRSKQPSAKSIPL